MNRIFTTCLPGLTALVICANAAAGGMSGLLEDYQRVSSQGKASTRIGIDNDSLLLNKDDQFYSSGLQLTRQHTLSQGTDQISFGWRIGQQLYTASDTRLPPEQVGPPNHPYAAWLYGGFFKETRRDDGTHLRYGLDVGCLGPCAGGEWTQKNLHRLLDQPQPQGWDKQVRNEWGAIVYGEMAPVRWRPVSWMDATPIIHGRFGNIHTDVGSGITVRAGRLLLLDDRSGLHGFLRLDARAVVYNATLQGGYFSTGDPHTVKPKRAVGEAELGLAWHAGPWLLSGSVVRRSTEIAALSNAQGAQNFVRLLFSYTP